MNYLIINDKGPFNVKVIIFDSVNNYSIGVMVKYHITGKLTDILDTQNENFRTLVLKIRKKDLQRFKEAMRELEEINTKLYEDQYSQYCNSQRQIISYQEYIKRNKV